MIAINKGYLEALLLMADGLTSSSNRIEVKNSVIDGLQTVAFPMFMVYCCYHFYFLHIDNFKRNSKTFLIVLLFLYLYANYSYIYFALAQKE